MRKFLSILVIFAAILVSCDMGTTSSVETSSEARVNSFSFKADTINPGLAEGTYKIVHSSDTGLIYNIDSLRFGTCLDSVVPLVTYKATPGAAYYVLPDTTLTSTGVDTVNLNQHPIYLHVVASDMKSEMWYRIELTVHQVDPDLYVWKQLTEQVFDKQYCETKAFWMNDGLVLMVNNGLSTQVYQSADGSTWRQVASTVASLPTPCRVREIVQHANMLYYADKQTLYYSADGIAWEAVDYSQADFELVSMLLSYHEQAWAVVQDKNSKRIALATVSTSNIAILQDIDGLEDGYLPAHFPISEFAALEFESSSERPRAMIVGGRAMNGDAVNSRWNMEYSKEDGYRLRDFTISQPSFHSLTGASIVQYDNQLLMFGGIDNDLEWRSDMLYSDDEGMHWYAPDTTKNKLPESYKSRQFQSVVIDNDYRMYIIGGQTDSETLSDVYSGKRNLIGQ